MYCSECGCEMEEGMLFCPECGKKAENPEGTEEKAEGGEQEEGQTEAAAEADEQEESREPDVENGTADGENGEAEEMEPVESEKGRATVLSVAKVLDRRVDNCFHTRPGKVIWGILAAGAAVSVCLLGGRGTLLQKNYGWLNDYELTEEYIAELQTELAAENAQAAQAEQGLEAISARYENLEAHDISKNWENVIKTQIVERSAENQMIVQEFKAQVMKELGYAYTPSYSQRQYEEIGLKDFRDAAIDKVAGGMLGEGLKGALDAAAEDASLGSILEGAKEGLIKGSAGYVQDKVLGDLGNSVLGVLETGQSIKDKIESMGMVPPAALNGMLEQQKQYLEELQQFAGKEKVTAEDMQKAYDTICSYRSMTQIMKAMTGEGSQSVEPRDLELEALIGNYRKNEELIRKYVELGESEAR